MKQFTKFTEKYGKGINYQSIDISEISEYDQFLLTPEILNILTEEGVSSYGNGLFWTINPNDYVEVLNDWLSFEDRSIPFMRSAFGDMLFMREGNIMVLNSNTAEISLMTDDVEEFMECYLTDSWFLNNFFNSENFSELKELEPNECFSLKSKSVIDMKTYLNDLSKSKDIQFFEH